MDTQTERAYSYCRVITRHYSKSFYFAAMFLPRAKRNSIYAIYALCRRVDDEVDEVLHSSDETAAQAVEQWRQFLNTVYDPAPAEGLATPGTTALILVAWRDLLERFPIDKNLPLDLMRGVLMDTYKNRYESFADLYTYCYRVASTVGLMTSEIFGYSDSAALKFAEKLGIAMQLTNILRDVREDARKGRIYLPLEDLQSFNLLPEDIMNCRFDSRFIRLMQFETARARGYYREADVGIGLLNRDSRFPVLYASRIYSKILDEIEKREFNVFSGRASTSAAQKILALPRVWLDFRSLRAA
jgi:15-cis-phytoene synthase